WAYYDLGRLATLETHDLQQARTYLEKSRALFRESRFADYHTIIWLAGVERSIGNLASAQKLYKEYLVWLQAVAASNRPPVAFVWSSLASVARTCGLFEHAARLLGAVDSSALVNHAIFRDDWAITYDDDLQAVRDHLGETRFAEAFAEGQAFTVDELI